MIRINKKSIIFGLIMLAILALGAIAFLPNLAAAEGGRNVHFGPDEEEISAPRVNSRSASDGADIPNELNESGRNVYVTEYVLVEKPVTVQRTPSPTTLVETEPAEEPEKDEEEISDMAANALFGGSTFLPSGLTQWILFIIFILLMVILVRRLSGAEAAYHASPLKHD